MIDVTLRLNGTDISGLLSTFNVTHQVEVREIMTSLDGTEHYATIRRPEISFSLIPLSDEQTADLYNILSEITIPVVYTDPYLGNEAFGNMRVVSGLESTFGLRSIDGNRYYKGGTIVLRQRTAIGVI